MVDGNKTFLFYLRLNAFSNATFLGNCSLWMLESFDNSQTWTNDREIDEGGHDYVNTGTNVLRMRNGTLIVPIAWDGNASVLRSDDDGLTWSEGEAMHVSDVYNTTLDEPGIVELTNGSLYCLLRTYITGGIGKHFCAISNDYGLTWSVCLPVEEMSSFNTTPALLRYSWNPNVVVAAWIDRASGPDAWGRRPLVAAYSLDDCSTWKGIKVIDNGEISDEGEPISALTRSMNEPNFVASNGNIIVGYRTYLDRDHNKIPIPSDAVTQKFALTFFADRDSLVQAFGYSVGDGYWNPCVDMNQDGSINILDAIILAKTIS